MSLRGYRYADLSPKPRPFQRPLAHAVFNTRAIATEIALAEASCSYRCPSMPSPLYTALLNAHQSGADPNIQLAYIPLAYKIITRVSRQPHDVFSTKTRSYCSLWWGTDVCSSLPSLHNSANGSFSGTQNRSAFSDKVPSPYPSQLYEQRRTYEAHTAHAMTSITARLQAHM